MISAVARTSAPLTRRPLGTGMPACDKIALPSASFIYRASETVFAHLLKAGSGNFKMRSRACVHKLACFMAFRHS